ncbi:HAD family hydrolase [Pedobacter heparinus]|uniref:HAD family hydrolase n=1 Tax=Pedobacter heparinus TaxID=984 RepID=UPI00292DCD32|nr:haloacid dehalogenase-like hydrolase [Pedobacter heparinus]
MKSYRSIITALFLIVNSAGFAQSYQAVKTWSKETNDRIESFLAGSNAIKERKVAVFDCDGTLMGQVPYYLADEAFISYAKKTFEGKSDNFSKEKMKIVRNMFGGASTASKEFVLNRISYMAGMTDKDIIRMGEDCFNAKYQAKIYPEMRQLVANLQNYGFEVWVVTTSPELLYQQFVHEEFGIPVDRIIGLKSVIKNNVISNEVVLPVPMDNGKAETIQTFIKAKPLFVGGNSRGDMEMMNIATGLKLIVNPDDQKVEKGSEAGAMDGNTVKSYWEKQNAVIVHCKDITESLYHYDSAAKDIKLKQNKPTN